MVFQTRKIRSETLSEYLVEARSMMGLSLDEVSQQTGIQVKFLELLENNKFSDLPPEVYVCGFLKQIAEIYGIDSAPLIVQYKKERNIVSRVDASVSAQKFNFSALSRISFTPKTVSLGLIGLFFILTLGYVGLQLKVMSRDPSITVLEPQSGAKIEDSFVKITGTTEPGNQVSINNADVFVGENGSFTTTVSIATGQTDLAIVAKNKFDKTTEKHVSVIHETAKAALSAVPQPSKLTITVTATARVTIGIKSDQLPVALEQFEAGITKQFGASDRIELSTSDAGYTRVTVNGRDLGVLGRKGESLQNVPFTQASALLVNAGSGLPNTNF